MTRWISSSSSSDTELILIYGDIFFNRFSIDLSSFNSIQLSSNKESYSLVVNTKICFVLLLVMLLLCMWM